MQLQLWAVQVSEAVSPGAGQPTGVRNEVVMKTVAYL